MKQCYAILLSLLFFGNCNLPERYIEKENYDAAFRFASNRLDRKRQKTQHLQTLEIAFAAANERDLATINEWKKTDSRQSWERIYSLYGKMQIRHEKVRSLYPLASDDGYRPKIKTYPVEAWRENSYEKVVGHYLQEIRNYLQLAEAGKKLEARKAHKLLEQLEGRYNWNNSLVHILSDSCYMLGTTYILLGVEPRPYVYNAEQIADWINNWNINLKSDWKILHRVPHANYEYDFIAHVSITNTYVSNGTVSTSSYTNCKDVEVGKREVKDTSGKVTYEPIYQEVCATMTEIELRKNASVEAYFVASNAQTGEVVSERRICGTDSFCDSDCTYSGDSRAVDKIGCSIGCPSYRFPGDWEMLRSSAHNLNWSICRRLKKLDVLE